MRRRQASFTATGIALLRALESMKPAGERICYDPFARQFVSSAFLYFIKFEEASCLGVCDRFCYS